jgi:hypothetical protein
MTTSPLTFCVGPTCQREREKGGVPVRDREVGPWAVSGLRQKGFPAALSIFSSFLLFSFPVFYFFHNYFI